MRMVKLKCENCGGQLEINSEQDRVFCEYCGAEILIDDNAYELKRVENVKLQARKQNHEQTLKEKKELKELEEIEKFKNGKLSKFVIIFTIICLLFVFLAFEDGEILPGIIGIIQIGCFSVGWLSGVRIIKEKFKGMHTVLIIIGFALIIPFFEISFGMNSYNSSTECYKINWKNINLKNYLVEYEKPYGEISINSDTSFTITLCNVSNKEYKEYLDKTRNFGYTVNSEEYNNSFYASSDNGYKISLTWYKNYKELYISLSKSNE